MNLTLCTETELLVLAKDILAAPGAMTARQCLELDLIGEELRRREV